MGIAEETVIAYPHKAVWEYMKQETAYEFSSWNGHVLGLISIAIVLIAEGDVAMLELEETMI
jgi:hypothetical protein